MAQIVIQEGYTMPFDGPRKKRNGGGPKLWQAKFKSCAKSWKKGSGNRTAYNRHMKACLNKGK